MSIFTDFYAGDAARLTQLINDLDFRTLNKDPAIARVSFGGAIMIPDDFTMLIEACDRQQGTSFRNFRGVVAAQIWGDQNDDAAESQAFVLRDDAVRALAALGDDAIRHMLERHEAMLDQHRAENEKAMRRWRMEERIKTEIAFHLFPFIASMLVMARDDPLWLRIVVPIAAFGLFWAIRLRFFGNPFKRKPPPEDTKPKTFDWMPRFRKWRRLLSAAADEGRAVVYLWSL